MRLSGLLLPAVAVAGLSACVVVDPLPVTGPGINGVPTAVPSGPSLSGNLRNSVLRNTQTGESVNLWSDGSYTVSRNNGGQAFGTWRAVDANSTMCFTGPIAAYARGACIPIRYDGDFLELFDAGRTRAMDSYQVL